MLKKLERLTSTIIRTVTDTFDEAQKRVTQGDGAIPKVKSATTTTTTITVTPLDQRAAETLGGSIIPLDVISKIIEHIRAECKTKQILKFRELNTVFRDMIDVGSVADKILVKITTEDLAMGGKVLLEKLEFMNKNNLLLSLDIDIYFYAMKILNDFFSVTPKAAASIFHVLFGEIVGINQDAGNRQTTECILNFLGINQDSSNARTATHILGLLGINQDAGNIQNAEHILKSLGMNQDEGNIQTAQYLLHLLAMNEDKLLKLSSMHIEGIKVGKERHMALPNITSLTSLSIGRLDGQIISNLTNLIDLHIDVLSLSFPRNLSISAKNIFINTLEHSVIIESKLGLQKLVIKSTSNGSNIFLGSNLPALEEIEVFTHESAPVYAGSSSELIIQDILPNLKRLHMPFYPGGFVANSANLPAIEEITYPERLKDLPAIQEIERDIELRKSQRGDLGVEI